MSAGNDASLGMVIADRYILLEQVGEGRSGVIFRAEHTVLRNRLAVKLLHETLSEDEEAVKRYHDVITTSARIESDHVVKVTDFGRTEDGRLFVAMDYLEGETLAELLAREGRLDEARAAALLEQIADALGEAHELGLVHGDIRPRNIYITRKRNREVVKLMDLGLATLMPAIKSKGKRADAATDPRYVSPERARGGEVVARSDIYALGIVGYELVNGSPPFVGTGTFDVLTKHLEARPLLLADKLDTISEHYSGSIDRALSKRPERRYPTMERFVEALTGAGPVHETDDERVERQKRRTGAHAAATEAAGVQALASAAASNEPDTDTTPFTKADADSVATAIAAQTAGSSGEPQKTLVGYGITADDVAKAIAEKEAQDGAIASAAPGNSPVEGPAGPAIRNPAASDTLVDDPVDQGASAAAATAKAADDTSSAPTAATTLALAPPRDKKKRTRAKGGRGKSANTRSGRDASSRAVDPATKATVTSAESEPLVAGSATPAAPPAPDAAPATTLPLGVRPQTVVPGPGVELRAEVFSAATIVPETLDTDKMREMTSRVAALDTKAPADGSNGTDASRKRRVGSTSEINAAIYDDPDGNRSQTGNWFAEGMRAEQALVTGTKSQPLPAMYGSFDELDLEPKRRISSSMIIVAVVGLAVIIFGMIFLLKGRSGPKNQRRRAGELRLVKGRRSDLSVPRVDATAVTAMAKDVGAAPRTPTPQTPTPQTPAPDSRPPTTKIAKAPALPPQKLVKPPIVLPKKTPPKKVTPKPAAAKPALVKKPKKAPRRPHKPKKIAKKPIKKPAPAPSPAALKRKAARTHVKAGRKLLRRGSYSKARAAFQKALELDSRSAPAYGGLGEVAFELGNYASASGHLRRAVRLDSRSSRYRVMLGNVYFKQGKTGAAVKQYRRALKSSPGNRAARTGLEAAIRRLSRGS